MSDFFGALVRRVMAPAAVRPRLGSRFESGRGLSLNDLSLSELHEQRQAVVLAPEVPPAEGSPKLTVPPIRATPDVAFEQPPVRERSETARVAAATQRDLHDERQPEARSARLAEVQPLIVPPSSRGARAAPAHGAKADSSQGRTPQGSPPVAPLAPLPQATERIVRELTEQQIVRSPIEFRGIERLTAEPRPPSASSRTTAGTRVNAPPAAPAAPRVEIHIGRIEVVPAAAPAVEPQRIEAPRPFPAQSLDAYLAERSSGRRS